MKPTTYPEMNAKIKDILRTGNQASQYAAQRIEELEDEVSRYRTEAANERELSEGIVAERETLIIENERQQDEIERFIEALENIRFHLGEHHPMSIYITDFLKGGETK